MNSVTSSLALDRALAQAQFVFQAGAWAEADGLYRALLRAHPDCLPAMNELARVCQKQGRLSEAEALFRQIVARVPQRALAHGNLAVVLCEQGMLEESFAAFQRQAELTYRIEPNAGPLPTFKNRHDAEQRAYLQTRLGAEGVLDRFHVGDGRRVEGGALAPQPAQVARMMDGQERVPPVVVLDNFLTEEALRKLRLFCWESTIWRHVYPAGYLGAMPEHGFGTPLLAQIATELRETYPTLFRAHPLRHYWAFKYDSTLKGIALHADFAAVNVNFWITPDAANRDPAHGGLVIWDKPAPFAWDFRTYNDNVAAARAFLAEQGATAQTIPYRANRAVIFDSNLFHETDQLSFEEGYLNRRINVTLLFGQRESI